MTRCKWKKCAVILNCMTSCFVQEPADKTVDNAIRFSPQ